MYMLLFFTAILLLIVNWFVSKQSKGTFSIIPATYTKYVGYFAMVMLLLWANPFIYNTAGYRTYAQDPLLDKERVIFAPGIHWAGFVHRTQEWPDVTTTTFDEENPVRIQFNDGTGALVQANVRWNLPADEQAMIKIHKAYRTVEHLQEASLIPYAKECLNFSGGLMESEVHYSGGQSKFKEDFRSQLADGQYVLEAKVDFQMDTATKEQIKITTVHLRQDANGMPIRIPSDVQTYQIQCAFAAVPKVTYDSIVYRRLIAKIEQSTTESISKQTLITAQQQALTAKANGEKLIAEVRAKELAAKEEAVIQAQMAKEVAAQQAQQAEFEAKKTLTEGRALAEANRLKVSAGLTPLEKAQFDMDTKIGVAKAMSEISFPSTMIIGGGNGGAVNPFDMIGLQAYYNMVGAMSKKD